jgi:hypothetical protein
VGGFFGKLVLMRFVGFCAVAEFETEEACEAAYFKVSYLRTLLL